MTSEKTSKTWEEHWAEGHIPWDAGDSSPSLAHFINTHPPAPGARALVPGCGSGYDVFRLAAAGYESVGLDLATGAAPRFNTLRDDRGLSAEQARIVTADFFTLDVKALPGPFDVIWDYTFYCAIDLAQRDAWRDQMARLLAPGGTLAMLLFPVVPGAPHDQGPPFPLDPDKVAAQLAPKFARHSLEPAPGSHAGREGKEWLSTWKAI